MTDQNQPPQDGDSQNSDNVELRGKELREKLMELIYDLLPADETAKLEEQVTSDPQVARAYAEVKLDTDLLGKAALLENKQLKKQVRLKRPNEKKQSATTTTAASKLPQMTPWHWSLATAAALLVAVTLGGWVYQEANERSIAANHMRLLVTGPATLREGVDNRFNITTQTVDGEPLEADLEYVIYAPNGNKEFSSMAGDVELPLVRDGNGNAVLTVPASVKLPLNSRLEIRAFHGDHRPQMTQPLVIEEDNYVTLLSLDEPWYKPGETVY